MALSSNTNEPSASGSTVHREVLDKNHNIISEVDEDYDLTESDINVHQDISEQESSKVILSVICQGNMLGAATYDMDTCQMQLMIDHSETPPEYPLLHMLIKQMEPLYIITSSKNDERILNHLRESELSRTSRAIDTSDDSETGGEGERFIQILPNMDFALESSKHRLQNLEFPGMPKNMSESEKKIYLSTVIDFTNICMISFINYSDAALVLWCMSMHSTTATVAFTLIPQGTYYSCMSKPHQTKAAGGLLKFLEKKRINIELEDEGAQTPILSVSLFSLKNIVALDDNTFKALQIFHQEKHPSVYKSGKGMKEGLSLFGIFNRCRSAFGSKEMRRWFLFPTNDLKIIEKRQAAITFLSAAGNVEITNSLHGCLKYIRNVPRILHRMKTAEASITDWQALYKTAYHAMIIGDLCRSQSQQIEIFQEISAAFSPDLFRIANLIHRIVDFDESSAQNRFVVKPGVDDQLDNKKRTYNGLPDFMTVVAHQELEHLSEEIQECSVIYLPQLGYLLAIPQTEHMEAENDFNIDGLEFMFAANNVLHYKSPSTRELDRLLGDTQCDITDYETQIMHRLQNIILEMSQVLIDVVKYSAKLDCLISLSLVAKELGYIRPDVVPDGNIEITKGKHPLQELCVASFVPNDVCSGGEEGKIKIITGPNACGKSVYLKQVALIVYLSHLGSFIPAEKARIPLVDHIFTRIQTLESVSINLSTFLIHLKQMSIALNYATEKSLVIIDEFGKGTECMGGLALLTSSLLHWIKKGPACPHLYVSTHFHSLYKLLPASEIIKYKTMETLKDDKELVFLYQIVDGQADCSFAHNAALHVGLPKETVERAMKVSELLKNQQPVTPYNPQAVAEKIKRYKIIEEKFFNLNLRHGASDVREFISDVSEIVSESSPSVTTTSKDSSSNVKSS